MHRNYTLIVARKFNFLQRFLIILFGIVISQTANSYENRRIEFLVKSLVGSNVELTQKKDEYSYALGLYMSEHVQNQLNNLKNSDADLDKTMIIKGFIDGLKQQGVISSKQAEALMLELSQKIQESQRISKEQESAKNRLQSDEFIKNLQNNNDYVVRPSGLRYRIIREGSGSRPGINDTVLVHYKGALTDGTIFDNSYERGNPSRFEPSQVIEGWKEALMMMRSGAHWEVIVPPELGYGENGSRSIPGNSVLVFEIELLDID